MEAAPLSGAHCMWKLSVWFSCTNCLFNTQLLRLPMQHTHTVCAPRLFGPLWWCQKGLCFFSVSSPPASPETPCSTDAEAVRPYHRLHKTLGPTLLANPTSMKTRHFVIGWIHTSSPFLSHQSYSIDTKFSSTARVLRQTTWVLLGLQWSLQLKLHTSHFQSGVQ